MLYGLVPDPDEPIHMGNKV